MNTPKFINYPCKFQISPLLLLPLVHTRTHTHTMCLCQHIHLPQMGFPFSFYVLTRLSPANFAGRKI
ncbi:hypothetical protein HanRHA438_Chr11g0528381 [Helianthus annuus]|nr:hypothetical protein HanRHA438_Chr11g0528381 [Helianthus annuus]